MEISIGILLIAFLYIYGIYGAVLFIKNRDDSKRINIRDTFGLFVIGSIIVFIIILLISYILVPLIEWLFTYNILEI